MNTIFRAASFSPSLLSIALIACIACAAGLGAGATRVRAEPVPAPSLPNEMCPEGSCLDETSPDGKWNISVVRDTVKGEPRVLFLLRNSDTKAELCFPSNWSTPGGDGSGDDEFEVKQANGATCYWSPDMKYLLMEEAAWRGGGGVRVVALAGRKPLEIKVPEEKLMDLANVDWAKCSVCLVDPEPKSEDDTMWVSPGRFRVSLGGSMSLGTGRPNVYASCLYDLQITPYNTLRIVRKGKVIINQ